MGSGTILVAELRLSSERPCLVQGRCKVNPKSAWSHIWILMVLPDAGEKVEVSEWNKAGAGAQHTLASQGGYGSWRGAGLAGSEALHPKGTPERNRLVGGWGRSLL